ncbi:MAG: sensor histidine kinase [Acidimicrobiales bacterium]
MLQVVVLALALVRLAVTVAFDLTPDELVLEISTVTVFVVPVVVASLEYGLSGALSTVAWVSVLCIPRLTEAADRGESSALWVELLQLAILAVIAVLIGQRVSAASISREQADAAREARLRAERLYQEMFESNQSPILIVDSDGYVIDANASADRSFATGALATGHPVKGEHPLFPRLVDVIGPEAAALVLTRLISDVDRNDGRAGDPDEAGDERVPPVAFEVDGQPVLYRPTATLVGAMGSDCRMQVIFEDVTAETRRHDLMEAYAGQVVLGQEEERRHIAQELHDGPLQTLIHLCRQIDSLDAGSGGDGEAAPSLASMRITVEETVAELRSIARGLRPSVLDDLGLVASINQVLTEATERQGFEGRFEVTGTVRRLPSAVELALFRIAQEAITNVERHADAHQVSASLEFADDRIRLRVEDDGEGFDRGRQRREDDGQSLGLPGMGERARLVGGRLRITSQVGVGTTVEATIPTGSLGTR